MRKWIPTSLAILIVSVLMFSGLYALKKGTREHLRDTERVRVAFADIECAAPQGQARTDFLAEVQYLAGLPESMSLVEDGVLPRLSEGFAKHPWVKKVERVQIVALRGIRVDLMFRTPVLRVTRNVAPKPIHYLVDAEGVLLSAQPVGYDDLPGFEDAALPAPATPAGSRWSDRTLDRIVRLADFLRPHQGALHVKAFRAEKDEILFETAQGSRVHWGRAIGAESKGEPSADRKLAQLLEYCKRHGDLDHPKAPQEHDVRRSP